MRNDVERHEERRQERDNEYNGDNEQHGGRLEISHTTTLQPTHLYTDGWIHTINTKNYIHWPTLTKPLRLTDGVTCAS